VEGAKSILKGDITDNNATVSFTATHNGNTPKELRNFTSSNALVVGDDYDWAPIDANTATITLKNRYLASLTAQADP
jgi:hypothetical protein